jgi:hypothetical protein
MAWTPIDSLSADNTTVHGLDIYFRAWASDTAKATTQWTRLGNVSNIGGTPTQEVKDIFTGVDGLRRLFKRLVTSETFTVTFDTDSTLADEVMALHRGGAATGGKYKRQYKATKGELLIVARSAEDLEAIIDYYGAVNLRGTNQSGFNATDETKLSFEATSVVDTTDATYPYGYTEIVADASVATTLTALAPA